MGKQHMLVCDSDHIIVKGTRGNRLFGLLDKQNGPGLVQARYGFRRFDMLTCGKGSARHAVDKDLDAGAIVAGTNSHMIGRTFVAKGWRDRRMHGKMVWIGKCKPKLLERPRPFMAAMRHGLQIGDGQVAKSIDCVGRGRDCRGIGRPHRGSGQGRCAQMRFGGGDCRPEMCQPGHVRPVQRHEKTLCQTEIEIVPHLGDAL